MYVLTNKIRRIVMRHNCQSYIMKEVYYFARLPEVRSLKERWRNNLFVFSIGF